MSKKSIQIFEPMRQVTMKDGRLFFFPKSKEEIVRRALKEDSFLSIEGIDINKFEIKYIEDAPASLDILYGLELDVRNKVVARFAKFKIELGREPNKREKAKIIDKVKLGK